jgi:hypothetical protein
MPTRCCYAAPTLPDTVLAVPPVQLPFWALVLKHILTTTLDFDIVWRRKNSERPKIARSRKEVFEEEVTQARLKSKSYGARLSNAGSKTPG